VTLLGAGAGFESKWIRLADLKGNLFSHPETDEQYPTLWSQQRAVLLQLLGNPDPQSQSVLAHPENMALVKRLIGLEEFVIPEEESRTKQYREIAQLVAEQPLVHRQDLTAAVAPGMAAEAAASGSGAGADAEIILPSILPDEFADNPCGGVGNLHAVVFVGCGAGGEDRSAVGIRERARACVVPSGLFAEAAGASCCCGSCRACGTGSSTLARRS
jgi:hypothetical protein